MKLQQLRVALALTWLGSAQAMFRFPSSLARGFATISPGRGLLSRIAASADTTHDAIANVVPEVMATWNDRRVDEAALSLQQQSHTFASRFRRVTDESALSVTDKAYVQLGLSDALQETTDALALSRSARDPRDLIVFLRRARSALSLASSSLPDPGRPAERSVVAAPSELPVVEHRTLGWGWGASMTPSALASHEHSMSGWAIDAPDDE